MLSDESSSDSETGRFKGRSKKQDEQKKSSNDDSFRSAGRSRPSEHDRFHREFQKRRDERDRFDRHSRERQRFSRHSPVRRRHSRERSANRSREYERHRHAGDSGGRSKPRERRSNSKDRRRHSRSRSRKSPEPRRDLKEEIKRNFKEEVKQHMVPTEKSAEKFDRKSKDLPDKSLSPDYEEKKSVTHKSLSPDYKGKKSVIHKSLSPDYKGKKSVIHKSLSPDYKGKKSEIHKPTPVEPQKKNDSPIIVVEEHVNSDGSEEVQPGSYYSMIPAVVKDKSEESSEIDSSDDERLRAKLLNLEKELQKTRKKKHKRKHKKCSKSSKDRDKDPSTVEVSSTTDIDKTDVSNPQADCVEVTSTQKSNQKESSEEGEISSDDDPQDQIAIDPTDLRHKLKRAVPKVDINNEQNSSERDACGPALPPHLETRFKRSTSRDTEGPALPPHLKRTSRNIGPSIPEDLRKVLAETDREVIQYESSDEDIGIGPLPVGADHKWSDAHQRLEERALDMKIRKLDGHSLRNADAKSREQWMLELPEAKAKYLGLEARSFRAKAGPDMSDRSSWTDTPEEKARKAAGVVKEEDPDVALQREARARHISSRDEEQETAVKKHKKKHKREESLLDMHKKKLKKKKKKDEKDEDKKERRPFSRDVDLQVNRFDEAQKKSIIKKAQGLNTRFSRGEAKFL